MWIPVLFVVMLSPQGGYEPAGGPMHKPFETKAACEDFLVTAIGDGNEKFQTAYKDGKIVLFCIDVMSPET